MEQRISKAGFPSTKLTIEDNQTLDTLIALRRCKDGLKHCGGMLKFEVSKSVLTAVRGAKTRYERDVKSKQSEGKTAEKRKQDKDINMAAAKIKRLTDEVKHLISVADTKAKEAENKKSLKLKIESNVLRESAKRKESEIVSAEKELEKLKTTM